MQYKLCCLTLLTMSMGVVMGFAAPVEDEFTLRTNLLNAVETLSYTDYNGIMWLHRMLSERDRWDFWELPETVSSSDADFVRGLAAFGITLYRSEIMRHWSYGTKTEPAINPREEYAYRINQKIVQPCERVVAQLGASSAPIKQAKLAGRPINLVGLAENWLTNETNCEKIVADPKHWIDASFEVAKKNHLI